MKAVLIFLLACMAFTTEASVTVRIAAEPEALLPGLFPVLRIWITNSGTEAVEVPNRVALQVIPPRGEPFVAYSGLRGEERTMPLVMNRTLTVAAGETRDVSFWSRDDWFGADPRFRTTGAFRLQLIADQGLDSGKLDGLTRVLDQSGLVRPLVSNETIFTALEPQGVDLAVWNAMKGKSPTCTPQVTELIWREYPTSRYAAYCVRHNGDALSQIAGYEASLAKTPHPIRAETYRLNLAQAWLDRGWLLNTRDVDAAVEAYDRARELLEPISRNGLSPEHRHEAARLLEEYGQTREQVVERYKILQGWNGAPIRLHYTCYEALPDGSRKVWFGYTNPNHKPVDVPLGNDNKVTPPPFDRGQPTRFKPGTFDVAFHVVTKEPVLVWHLQGETTQFKVPEAMACPKGFDPNDKETWVLEEEDEE